MLKGRVRLTLRPLLTRVPVIGAVQVALTEQPEFDFDITLGNNSSVPLEPALKNFIKQ
jgi:Ca2+-dependent lipid-binding protein